MEDHAPMYLYMVNGYIEISDVLELINTDNDIEIVNISNVSYMKIEIYSSNFAETVTNLIEKYRGGLEHPIYIGSGRTDLLEIDKSTPEDVIYDYLYSTF